MAAYQGARKRGLELPRPSLRLDRPLLADRGLFIDNPRPTARPFVGARRPTRVGAILAVIIVAFSLAFLSLSQSVRVAATSYDLVRLGSQYERLDARRQTLESDLNRLGSEPAIRKLGLDGGLGQLDAPVIVPAR